MKLVLSGFDTFEILTSKYRDTPSILEEIRKQQEKTPSLLVSIRHGVNAIINQNSSHIVDDETAISADHVLFQHPHLGTENCSLHKRFLAHLFHSATNHWMKRNGGIFHLTLVEGQYDRWECEEQAKRHGLDLLHQAPFVPPPITYQSKQQDSNNNDTQDESRTTTATATTETTGNIILKSNLTNNNGLNGNRYHYRRHQTGKSFASRRPKSISITYNFGRTIDKDIYVATALPWQQLDCSSSSTTGTEGGPISATITNILATRTTTSVLSCPFCDKEFLEKRSRKNHIRDKHSNECPIDEIKKPTKKRKKEEATSLSTQADGSPLFCQHCQNDKQDESSRRIFQSVKALEAHVRAKHSAIYKYIAPDWSIAKQKEENNNIDHQHPNNHDGNGESNVVDKSKVEECHICGLRLVGRSFLQHLQDFVPVEGSQTFSCLFCSKSFQEERAKLQHMNFCSKRLI